MDTPISNFNLLPGGIPLNTLEQGVADSLQNFVYTHFGSPRITGQFTDTFPPEVVTFNLCELVLR